MCLYTFFFALLSSLNPNEMRDLFYIEYSEIENEIWLCRQQTKTNQATSKTSINCFRFDILRFIESNK